MKPDQIQCGEWRPCPGYEGIYEVSSCGRVKRIAPGKRNGKVGHVLTGGHDEKGYRIVLLSRNGKGTTKKVHRLVSLAFLGESNGLQVNHKDGNKDNNCFSNLEYATNAENCHHAIGMGLIRPSDNGRKNKHVGKKITLNDARTIRAMEIAGIPRPKIAQAFNIHKMTVGEIVRNEIWAE